jgi:hypothetical protein
MPIIKVITIEKSPIRAVTLAPIVATVLVGSGIDIL